MLLLPEQLGLAQMQLSWSALPLPRLVGGLLTAGSWSAGQLSWSAPDWGLPLEAGSLAGVLVLLLPEQLGLAQMQLSWSALPLPRLVGGLLTW